MADAIVDIVETGKTLQENGLIVFEEMYFISARMIVNKAALKTKKDEIFSIINMMEQEILSGK